MGDDDERRIADEIADSIDEHRAEDAVDKQSWLDMSIGADKVASPVIEDMSIAVDPGLDLVTNLAEYPKGSSEGSDGDDTDDTIPIHQAANMSGTDVDEDLFDAMRDAFKRLNERGFGARRSTIVYVGENAHRRLAGDAFDIAGSSMEFSGMPVIEVHELPDDRVMLADADAVEPKVTSEIERRDSPGLTNGGRNKVSERFEKLMAHPEAIEFVPEAEVDRDG